MHNIRNLAPFQAWGIMGTHLIFFIEKAMEPHLWVKPFDFSCCYNDKEVFDIYAPGCEAPEEFFSPFFPYSLLENFSY